MKFVLSDTIYKAFQEKMKHLSQEMLAVKSRAGTDNPKFDAAWKNLLKILHNNNFAEFAIKDRFDLRALSVALSDRDEIRRRIRIQPALLEKIDIVASRPSKLFVDALFQYFLRDFDAIDEPDDIGQWLIEKRKATGTAGRHDEYLLCTAGPKTMAIDAIQNGFEFSQQVKRAGLQDYASGDFIKRATSIYYVEQLKRIPENQPHSLLDEIAKPEVAGARYDDSALIGHIALRILIDRAPAQNVHESWQNCIIAIAGDPRIPKGHERYIKWWSQIDDTLTRKVRGWLSKLDLKLFLEALEDYSKSSRDEDMMRMFPSRKSFLEGMHAAGAILHTKLYLSRKAQYYIRRNYNAEHIPDYSVVENGDRSIIYAELTHGHMIEGSHNCQIWFYDDLPEHAFVRQFNKQRMSYEDLTGDFNRFMTNEGYPATAHFTHTPSNFNWQRKSLNALKNMGVGIRAMDVLSATDYKKYKRLYGVE